MNVPSVLKNDKVRKSLIGVFAIIAIVYGIFGPSGSEEDAEDILDTPVASRPRPSVDSAMPEVPVTPMVMDTQALMGVTPGPDISVPTISATPVVPVVRPTPAASSIQPQSPQGTPAFSDLDNIILTDLERYKRDYQIYQERANSLTARQTVDRLENPPVPSPPALPRVIMTSMSGVAEWQAVLLVGSNRQIVEVGTPVVVPNGEVTVTLITGNYVEFRRAGRLVRVRVGSVMNATDTGA